MERVAIANVETEDDIYIKVSDTVVLDHIPEKVKDLIQRFVHSMKINDLGLPASGFMNKGAKVTGIFQYGELYFLSFEGSVEDLEGDTLLHIFSNITEEDYDEMVAKTEEFLAQYGKQNKTDEE